MVIPLPQQLVDELLALRAVHHGADWAEYTTNGRRLLRRVLDRAWGARRDALGRVLDLHPLRHTAATGMARRGVPLVVAQRVLGHASPEMTAKVYTHLGLEGLRSAVEGVSELWRGREVVG